MKSIFSIFDLTSRLGRTRFDQYYSSVARSGAGYPTADEARRDLNNQRRSQTLGWPTR